MVRSKMFHVGSVLVNLCLADDGKWDWADKKGYKYTDYAAVRIATEPGLPGKCLTVTLGPLMLCVGWA